MTEASRFVPSAVVPAASSAERSTLALLESIEHRLANVEASLERVAALEETIPGALGTAADAFDGLAERLHDRGVDLEDRMRVLADVAERLTSPEALKAVQTVLAKLALVQHLLDSGILAETSVDVVGKAGYALAAARAEAPRQVGLWGAARAMSDDDVQRAVGFLLRVAQLFGHALEEKTK